MARRAEGSPITWPCGPIHYRLATDGSPAGATALVSHALDRISAVSGYQFLADPAVERIVGEDSGYAGIDIAWVSRPDFAGADNQNAIGSGGAVRDSTHFRHGVVQLLRDWPGNMRADFGGGHAGPVLLHELGHSLGLSHTDDRAGIMYPTDSGVTDWSPQERAALKYLHQSCG